MAQSERSFEQLADLRRLSRMEGSTPSDQIGHMTCWSLQPGYLVFEQGIFIASPEANTAVLTAKLRTS